MKTLLVMRHAKSSWNHSDLTDHDRPLNNRGRGDAPRMGQLLRDEDLVPDIIITSTAKRAVSTAKYVVETSGFDGKVVRTEDFYLADPEDYIAKLQRLSPKYGVVMIVGHNPGMTDLVHILTDEPEGLTTANIAHIEIPIDDWADLTDDIESELKQIWRPREL